MIELRASYLFWVVEVHLCLDTNKSATILPWKFLSILLGWGSLLGMIPWRLACYKNFAFGIADGANPNECVGKTWHYVSCGREIICQPRNQEIRCGRWTLNLSGGCNNTYCWSGSVGRSMQRTGGNGYMRGTQFHYARVIGRRIIPSYGCFSCWFYG